MDKSTAQAIHDLHLFGRLSDDSLDGVRAVLGLNEAPEDDEDSKGRQAAASTSKGR